MLERFDARSVGFWLALLLSVPLSVVVHEVGHAMLGALAGYRVVSFGLGFRDPFLVVPVGRARFYLGRPLRLGLTLALARGLTASRRQSVLYFAGGIVANAISAAMGFALWSAGVRATFVAVFGAVSGVMALANALPFRSSNGKLVVLSDGHRILDALRGAAGEDEVAPGQRLASTVALRELCRRLRAPVGEVGLTLAVAVQQLELDDVEGAGAALAAPCLADPARDPWTLPLEKVVRALYALEVQAPGAEAALAEAEAACTGDLVGEVTLRIARAYHASGEGKAALAREALAAARASGRAVLSSAAEALVLEVDPPEDLAAAVRALVARPSPGRLPESARLRCLSMAARHLARAGAIEDARPLVLEALALAQRIAAGLPEGPPRERFLMRAGAPLREAVAAAETSPVPLFMGATAGVSPRRRRFTPALALLATLAGVMVALVVMTWRAQATRRSAAEAQTLLAATRVVKDAMALRTLREGDATRALRELERDLEENADEIEPDDEGAAPPEDVARALLAARAYRHDFPGDGGAGREAP